MRVGLDNKWGYSFKAESTISFEQEAVLGSHLARLNGEKCHFKDSTFQPDDDKHHFLPDGIQSIMGIGVSSATKSIGIVWNTNQNDLLQALFYANINDDNEPSWGFLSI